MRHNRPAARITTCLLVTATPLLVAALMSTTAVWAPAHAQGLGEAPTAPVTARPPAGDAPAPPAVVPAPPADAPAPPADVTAPVLTITTPADDATGVPLTESVTAMFSELVQGLDGASFTLRADGATTDVAATVTYDATTGVATLDPITDLAESTRYTATLTGGASALRDLAGNPLPTTSWAFTTQSPADV